jgi:hypothetical protein
MADGNNLAGGDRNEIDANQITKWHLPQIVRRLQPTETPL